MKKQTKVKTFSELFFLGFFLPLSQLYKSKGFGSGSLHFAMSFQRFFRLFLDVLGERKK